MDINSSGSVFCWPDAGGSWPEAWGCRSEALSLAWGAEPPTLKPRGGSWLPWDPLGRAGCQHLAGMSAWHGCLWHRQEGHAHLPTQSYAVSDFFLSFNLNLLQFYLQTLGNQVICDLQWIPCNTIQSGETPPKKEISNICGVSCSICHTTPAGEEVTHSFSTLPECQGWTRQLRNSKCCVKQGFIKIKYTTHIALYRFVILTSGCFHKVIADAHSCCLQREQSKSLSCLTASASKTSWEAWTL